MKSYSLGLDLSSAFDEEPGYHGTTWVSLESGELHTDRPVPGALNNFLQGVRGIVADEDLKGCNHGSAYMRVIDASNPENYMCWHIDNQDGGVRFSTAISTDGVGVNLAWPDDPSVVGKKVIDTDYRLSTQPDNGDIVVFTTEPHGVLPLQPRLGERTAVFFVTMYESREKADLYTCNNTVTPHQHATLPSLSTS